MSFQYNGNNIPLAQDLRKNATPQEKHLWYDFLSDYPVRFQRQKAIGNFIVDFYCHKAKLVIELDGSGHYEPAEQAADKDRDTYLNSLGLTVLRIPNNEINQNFGGVCEHIHKLLQI